MHAVQRWHFTAISKILSRKLENKQQMDVDFFVFVSQVC